MGDVTQQMTFAQFRASCVKVDDLAEALPANFGYEHHQPGLVYSDELFISIQADGDLHLHLSRDEYVSTAAHQTKLEAILYQWGLSEGYWVDVSSELEAARAAARKIATFVGELDRHLAIELSLVERMPGVCRLQDIADVWPILSQYARPDTDLDVAYELVYGALALQP